MCNVRTAARSRVILLSGLMAGLVVVGVANFVLVKVLFVAFSSDTPSSPSTNATTVTPAGWLLPIASTFSFPLFSTAPPRLSTTGPGGDGNGTDNSGDQYSFFVNQGINLLYVVVGGVMVYPRMCFTKDITPQMRRVPHKYYLVMATLDSFGTFFISMGAVCVRVLRHAGVHTHTHTHTHTHRTQAGSTGMHSCLRVRECACIPRPHAPLDRLDRRMIPSARFRRPASTEPATAWLTGGTVRCD